MPPSTELAALDPLQIAMWPSVRSALKAAYQSGDPTRTVSAWEMAANCELEAVARQDLKWQSEAFLDSPDPRFLRRSCQFHALGLSWESLGPAVADAARSRLEKWERVPSSGPEPADTPSETVGLWLSSCAFIACAGVGVFPARSIPHSAGKFEEHSRGFSPLPAALRAGCARIALAIAEDNAYRPGRLSNAEIFEHFFSRSRAADSGCWLYGFKEDFVQELRVIVAAAEIESATGPAHQRRGPPRV